MIGEGKWSLTFDGVDMRGGERGIGMPREAGVLSSDPVFWKPLLARATPIGEGDLKLTDVTQRVHDAARQVGTPVRGVLLNLVVTIDTDSLAIELLQQSRRERRWVLASWPIRRIAGAGAGAPRPLPSRGRRWCTSTSLRI